MNKIAHIDELIERYDTPEKDEFYDSPWDYYADFEDRIIITEALKLYRNHQCEY